jgi:O-antigen/teichoic acid export membrane protein
MLPLLKSTVKNSFIYSLGNLSTKIAGFILIPLYTKYLPLSDYGVLGLLEVTSTAIIVLFGLNLYSAFFRWYYDKNYQGRQKSLFFTTAVFLIVLSLLLALLIYPSAGFFSKLILNEDRFTGLFNLMLISSAIQVVATVPSTLLRLQERPLLFITANITRLVITLALTIYFIAYLHRGLPGLYEAQLIGNILYLILLVPYMFRNFEYRFEVKALKDMLFFSFPLILSSLSGIIISFSDRYFLNAMGNLNNTGLYSFAFKISNTIYYLIIDSVNLALSPVIFKIMYDKNSLRFYSKILTYLTFLVLLCIMALSFFGKEILQLISLRQEYWQAYKILPVLSFAALFMMLRDSMIRALNIVKKTQVVSFTIILVSFLNVLLNYTLIPLFQTMGAAIAFLITQIISFSGLYYFAQKYYPVKYENRKIVLMLLLAICSTAVAFMLNPLPLLLAIILKLLILAAFPVILYFMNFYEPIELQRIREILLRSIGKESNDNTPRDNI